MSILSVTATSRRRATSRAAVLAPAAPAVGDEVATLAGMSKGQRATVVGLDVAGDPAGARRLFDLGFVPGAEVQMVRRAPLADPIVFRVAGYEIALRREQARWVSVAASSS